LDKLPLELPKQDLRTTAYWLALDNIHLAKLQEAGLWKNDQNDYGPNWIRIRRLVRSRDQFTCQVCGLVEQGQAHHVHHITPFRNFQNPDQANRLENLITLCPNCHRRAETNVRMRSGLAGLGYVLHHLAPLFLMCDVNDLGMHVDPESPLSDGNPTVILYDQIPDGIGLSETVFDLHHSLFESAEELVSTCKCLDGCPACVGPAGEQGNGGKAETLALIRMYLGK
jgi:DEAD/DEAH box helicase domain-containing protein